MFREVRSMSWSVVDAVRGFFSRVGVAAFLVVVSMTPISTPRADTQGAMAFFPGDTEIYEAAKRGGPEVRYRISASARVHADTPRDEAERRAVAAWEAQAEREFGAAFGSWETALGKIVRCDPPGHAMYGCGVSAIPKHR